MSKFLLPGVFLCVIASLLKPTLNTNTLTDKLPINISNSYARIGNQIKDGRMLIGLSTEELAYRVGISNYEMEKIEENEAVPSKTLINKFNDVLKTKIFANR